MTLNGIFSVLSVIFLIGLFITCLCILVIFFGFCIYLAIKYIGKFFDRIDNKLDKVFRDKFY